MGGGVTVSKAKKEKKETEWGWGENKVPKRTEIKKNNLGNCKKLWNYGVFLIRYHVFPY